LDLTQLFQDTELGRYFWTFIISMVPVVELRGAIPVGVTLGLDPWAAMGVSVLGNMLPVPFIILFVRRVFEWLREKSPKLESLVTRLEQKAEGKWEKVKKYEALGLAIFVAIPLPGTGAWTGALIAALMNIRLKYAIPAIFLGVIGAGIIITGITYGFTKAVGA
jgi:uncharacterized membrane protein